MPTPQNSFTYKLTPDQQIRLIQLLSTGNFRLVNVPYTEIAVEAQDCRANLYTSGKCLVQGKGAEEFVIFYLEPNVLRTASHGYEEELDPDSVAPHMGVDESGKGDYFGPLCVCAAYTDKELSKKLKDAGAKDCKQMSDKQVLVVGAKLRTILGPSRYTVVQIGPQAYNRLYAKIKNINRLLAWGHARCIENLLNGVPDCPRAVADQFAGEQLIKRALMEKGKGIKLEQHHKAESDIAVAAASVIAREAFLRAVAKMREEHGLEIPKGSSAPAVRETAVELAKKAGPQILLQTVKCHFRTTDQVLAAVGATREILGPEGAASPAADAPKRDFHRHHKPAAPETSPGGEA